MTGNNGVRGGYVFTLSVGRQSASTALSELPAAAPEAVAETPLQAREYELKLKEYRLKVDEKVRKLLELQQNIVIFLITGAVGTVGYSLTFAATNRATTNFSREEMGALAIAAVLGLSAALGGLISLLGTLQSMRLDIKYTNQDKVWNNLTAEEQRAWDAVNKRSRHLRNWTPVLLSLSIIAQVTFFGLVLLK